MFYCSVFNIINNIIIYFTKQLHFIFIISFAAKLNFILSTELIDSLKIQ